MTSEFFQGGDDPIRVRANQFDPHARSLPSLGGASAEVGTLHHGDRLELRIGSRRRSSSVMRTSVIGILPTRPTSF